jgi:hypothetical protein
MDNKMRCDQQYREIMMRAAADEETGNVSNSPASVLLAAGSYTPARI